MTTRSAVVQQFVGLIAALLFAGNSWADIPSNGWRLGASRLIFDEGSTSATLWITNTSDRPWMVTGAVLQTKDSGDMLEKTSERLLVNPPAATVAPGKRHPVRLVWVGTSEPWPFKTEVMERLRLRLLPAKVATKNPDSSLQTDAVVYLKVFLRPKALVAPDGRTVPHRIELACGSGTLTAKNRSAYWVTLRSLQSHGVELISADQPAPMVPPLKSLEFPVQTCEPPFQAIEINDAGFPVPLPLSERRAP